MEPPIYKKCSTGPAVVARVIKPEKAKPAVLWGLLGGSFDPVHKGHIQTAHAVKQQLQLEKVLYLPAARSPFKGASAVENKHRAQMLRLMLAGHDDFELDTRELLRPPPSYTVDTLIALTKQFPGTKWVLILGADAWDGFNKWRDPEGILRLAHIAVMPRSGYPHKSDYAPGSVAEKLSDLSQHQAGKVIYIEVPRIDLSSTAIRKRLAKGQSTKYLLASKVAAYIDANNLYQ